MATCKHISVTITEHYDEVHVHTITKHEPEAFVMTTGERQPYVDVVCHDCGFDHRYPRSRMPKWVKRFLAISNLRWATWD